MTERSIPRVSDVLRLMDDTYEQIPEEILAPAAARGTYLHSICLSEMASRPPLKLCEPPKLEDIRPEYHKCFKGFTDWAAANQIEPILVEQRSVNQLYGFTGQPDLAAYKGRKRVKTVFDAKFTAVILAINRVQLRAYKELPLYQDMEAMEIVKVNWETGKVKSEPVFENGTSDWPAFLIALKKLRLLEEVEELDNQLDIWRGAA